VRKRITRRQFLGGAVATGVGMTALGGALVGGSKSYGAAGGKVTLNYLGRGDDRERAMYDQIFAMFKDRNPNIDIAVTWIPNGMAVDQQQKVLTMLAGGLPPDVMWTHTYITPGLVARGALMDVSGFIKKDHFDLGQYLAPAVQDFTRKGQIYGLPRETTAFVMIFNRTMLRAAGLPDPKPGWKWNDLLAMARAMTKGSGSDQVYGLYGMTNDIFAFTVKTWQNGGDLLNADRTQYTANGKPGVDSAQFIQDLIWKEKVHPTLDNIKTFGDLMAAGRAGFEPFYTAFIALKDAQFEWDVAAMPTDGKRVTRVASAGHAMLKGTKYPDEAWELLKFLASAPAFDAFIGNGIIMPARKDTFNTVLTKPSSNILVPKNIQVIRDAFGYGRPEPVAGNWVGVHTTLISALTNVWGPQKMDPKASLDAVAGTVNDLIKALPEAK